MKKIIWLPYLSPFGFPLQACKVPEAHIKMWFRCKKLGFFIKSVEIIPNGYRLS
jgi:hypothetical protein